MFQGPGGRGGGKPPKVIPVAVVLFCVRLLTLESRSRMFLRGSIQIGAARGRDAGAHRSGQIERGRRFTHRLSQDGTGFCFHRLAALCGLDAQALLEVVVQVAQREAFHSGVPVGARRHTRSLH
jgi:hypothetical protein